MNVRERLAYLAGELAGRAELGEDRGRPHRRMPLADMVWWSLAAEAESVPWARAQVRGQLLAWGLGRLLDSAELLVSELVTNAVLHGAGRIALRLTRTPARAGDGRWLLRCEVADDGAELPHVRDAEDTDESGRGLLLVDCLAARWGSEPTGAGKPGKIVWFELQ